jgi:translocation and assembly module TamB
LLQPLRAHFSDGRDTLHIEQLTLGSPQIKGAANVSGVVHLAAQPIDAALAIDWNNVRLPAELVGQPLASNGQLTVNGSTARFHAGGKLQLGPPGQLADLALNLDGTPQQITLHTLDLRQPRGRLQANGTLTLQPALAWQFDATAQHFDPGQLFAGWNGSLDAKLSTHGTLPQDKPDATLVLEQLTGTLRGRAVRGNGTLHLAPNRVLDGALRLASGHSSLAVTAKPGATNDVDLQLAIASLADWRTDANGRLDGRFHVGGLWPKLAVDGTLHGAALAWQQQTIERLALEAHLPDLSTPGGRLDLTAGGVHATGMAFQQIGVHGDGTAAEHRLTVDVRGSQLSGRLALQGSLKDTRWHGSLSELTIEPRGLPRWQLQRPAALGYANGAMSLSELCLSAGEPLLCVSGTRDAAGALDASYRLRALPLAMLLNAAGYAKTPLAVSGELQGQGTLHRSAAGALSGNAALSSPQGSVIYSDHAGQPLLAWRDLSATAELSPARQQLKLQASLDHGGRIDGQIAISGSTQTLAGQLAVHLNSLAPIELFTAELANVSGQLDGRFAFGGTLQKPQLNGQATISGFAAEVPTAGIKLVDGRLVASTTDAREFHLDGRVQSGKGALAIQGVYGLGAGTQTAITLKGQAFTAANIPAAQVVLSPDLVVKQDANGIDIGGALALDRAEVDLSRLPGGGGIKASPDVVVVDEKQQEQAKAQLPLNARVKVDLGRHTHVVGMGVDGRLTGVLTVIERPGRSTTGEGQVTVDGTYKAYGQNLTIQRGQLLFASTPIDNPGLNIRAVRKLNPNATIDEGQEVGLLITGTAQRPILTVFSNPPMEQSDALAYLITGKPLTQVSSGEGSKVTAAAQALGSAAGNLLAKRVGAKLGIDDIGVSSSEALGGSSAFTVGKYLSPRLYLSYGVGLFEPGEVITLRYRLSQRWNFEAQSATDFSRASLNYRIER